MALSRRSLLGSTAAAGVGLVAASGTGVLVSPAAADTGARRPRMPGPLLDDPAGLLALPPGGGCTVIDVTRGGDRISEWVGLSGTISNCAGGITPWNTWLTCEETEVKAGAVSGGVTLAQDQLHDGADPALIRGAGVTYFDGPDNVHVTPWGGLVLAEDGDGDGDGDNHLVGWTELTGAWPLARNQINVAAAGGVPTFNEFTGPNFAPTGGSCSPTSRNPDTASPSAATSGPTSADRRQSWEETPVPDRLDGRDIDGRSRRGSRRGVSRGGPRWHGSAVGRPPDPAAQPRPRDGEQDRRRHAQDHRQGAAGVEGPSPGHRQVDRSARYELARPGRVCWNQHHVGREVAGVDGADGPGQCRAAAGRQRLDVDRPLRGPVLRVDIDLGAEADDVEVRDHRPGGSGPVVPRRRGDGHGVADRRPQAGRPGADGDRGRDRLPGGRSGGTERPRQARGDGGAGGDGGSAHPDSRPASRASSRSAAATSAVPASSAVSAGEIREDRSRVQLCPLTTTAPR